MVSLSTAQNEPKTRLTCVVYNAFLRTDVYTAVLSYAIHDYFRMCFICILNIVMLYTALSPFINAAWHKARNH